MNFVKKESSSARPVLVLEKCYFRYLAKLMQCFVLEKRQHIRQCCWNFKNGVIDALGEEAP